MIEWQLAEAKNKLSEVITLALTKEPQKVRRRNQSVIIISEEEYRKLKSRDCVFVEYLAKGPSFEDLDLSRDTRGSREIIL